MVRNEIGKASPKGMARGKVKRKDGNVVSVELTTGRTLRMEAPGVFSLGVGDGVLVATGKPPHVVGVVSRAGRTRTVRV